MGFSHLSRMAGHTPCTYIARRTTSWVPRNCCPPGTELMKTLTKLGAFALALVLVFGSAYVVGRVVGPPPVAPAAATTEEEPLASGLEITGESMQVKVLTDSVQAGVPVTFAFQILQYDGTPLMKYKEQHDKLLHMIVA